MTKYKISSVQLMLTLFMAGISIILMQNYYNNSSQSFVFNLIDIAAGLIISLLFFVPFIIIKESTDNDFISFASKITPRFSVVLAIFYSAYFVYVISGTLSKYTDFYNQTLNPETNIYAVAAILMSVCVYAAHKGLSAVTRCGIFLFAFAIIVFAVIYLGNIPNLDFKLNGGILNDGKSGFVKGLSLYMTAGFMAVVFGCIAERVRSFKIKHIVWLNVVLAVIFIMFVFFVCFVLGDYGRQQKNQMFLLSKSVKFYSMGGIDCLFHSLVTVTIFLIISISLICISRFVGQSESLGYKTAFAVISFVLFICSKSGSAVKQVLYSTYVFDAITFIGAVFIPVIYIFVFRRKLNV